MKSPASAFHQLKRLHCKLGVKTLLKPTSPGKCLFPAETSLLGVHYFASVFGIFQSVLHDTRRAEGRKKLQPPSQFLTCTHLILNDILTSTTSEQLEGNGYINTELMRMGHRTGMWTHFGLTWAFRDSNFPQPLRIMKRIRFVKQVIK